VFEQAFERLDFLLDEGFIRASWANSRHQLRLSITQGNSKRRIHLQIITARAQSCFEKLKQVVAGEQLIAQVLELAQLIVVLIGIKEALFQKWQGEVNRPLPQQHNRHNRKRRKTFTRQAEDTCHGLEVNNDC